MELLVPLSMAKVDHQNATVQVDFAKDNLAKAKKKVQDAKVCYEKAKLEHRADDWELHFARNEVRLAVEEVARTTENLEIVQRLQSLRARALERAQQGPRRAAPPTAPTPRPSRLVLPHTKNPWNRLRTSWDPRGPKQCAKHYIRYRELKSSSRNGLSPSYQCQCLVTGIWADPKSVVGAPLLPLHTTPPNIQKLLHMQGRLHDMRNIVPLLKTIQQAYDQQRLCFVLRSDLLGYQIRILDPTLRHQCVHVSMTFEQLARKSFDFPIGKDGKRPFARCLSFHAQASFARALRLGWIEHWEPYPVEYGSPLGTDIISFSETESERSDDCVSDIEDSEW